MHRPLIAVSAIVALTLGSAAQAAELGSKAAPLKIAKWVKGEPVDLSKSDGKTVYVIEFWATWCAPCRASIPHLTELQKKYKDKHVTVVGVSDESVDTVSKFVEKQGDKMGYTVAVDDHEKTGKGYMAAFGLNGIPHAFIVDQQGKIVWHDHPMGGIDEVLDLVVAGKFDKATREKLLAQRKAEEEKLAAAQKAEAEKMRPAIEAIDKYATGVMEGKPLAEMREHAEKFLEIASDNPMFLNEVAWTLMMDEKFPARDMDMIEKMAKTAVDASKGEDTNILDTYAYALHKNGKTAEAIKVQEKALKMEEDEDLKKVLNEHMAEFKSQNS